MTHPLRLIVALGFLSLFIAACTTNSPRHPFAQPIEKAHNADTWHEREALQCQIAVDFGGKRILEGTMITNTQVSRTRFELTDGTTLVFDGSKAWIAPADRQFPRARFHALTWPYFLAAPMKLSDPGTNLKPLGQLTMDGKPCDAAKLSFDPGVGDAPDDWYILYRDPASNILKAMAYIVTYGDASPDEAEPHAIVYDKYVNVEGVRLSTEWIFLDWSKEKGPHGDQRGRATLSDLRFITPTPDTFRAPKGARIATLE